MGHHRSLRRARPASVLAGLALLSTVGVPLLEGTPVATAATTSPAATAGSARGDFNKDGYADLAIGVPLEDITAEGQGAVSIVYGSAKGLDPKGATPDQLLVQT